MKNRIATLVLSIGIVAGATSISIGQTQGDNAGAEEVLAEVNGGDPPVASTLEMSTHEGQSEPTTKKPAEVGAELYAAIRGGKWLAVVGFSLLLIVAAARRFGGSWAKTKAGGYVLGFGVPMLGALGLSLSQGAWSADLFLGALSAGLAASGLHTVAKDAKKKRVVSS